MNRRTKLLVLLISTVITFTLTVYSAGAQAKLTELSSVALNGIGPVRVGMTIAQAERAAGVRLVERGARAGGGGCYYLWPQPGPKNVGFMVISDRVDNRIVRVRAACALRNRDLIARVDVFRGSRITTLSGARIGDPEARIKALYPGRIKVSPHHYTGDRGGHYLTFVPKDAADRNYRLIFETDGKRVTNYRAGRLPEVEFIEGCA